MPSVGWLVNDDSCQCQTCLVCKKNIERLDIQVDDVGGVDEVHSLHNLPDKQLALLLGEVVIRGRESLKQVST